MNALQTGKAIVLHHDLAHGHVGVQLRSPPPTAGRAVVKAADCLEQIGDAMEGQKERPCHPIMFALSTSM